MNSTPSPNIPDIDWNAVLRNMHVARQQAHRRKGADYWNKRAPSFAGHAAKTQYPDAFIRILAPQPSWSVLDVGCGAGTLALPLAGMVARITAVDLSDKMLELLGKEIAKRGIANIHTVLGSWEADWEVLGIGVHDVAIASRSLIADDARAAIEKLARAARKRVAISTMARGGPFDSRMFEAVGRPPLPGMDYIYTYNLLHQMGIDADVSFIRDENYDIFENLEAAVEARRWMFQDMTPEEESLLEAYLRTHLVKCDGGWRLDYRQAYKWAVFHWDREEQQAPS